MNEKTIVLCLDIDETVMNSKTKPARLVDFNGSEKYNDATAWLRFLEETHSLCQANGFSFLVQIISSKSDALPDTTVDDVMSHLSKFLSVLDDEGNPVDIDLPKNQYMIRRYLKNNRQEDISTKIRGTEDDICVITNTSHLLPPIHLCSNNKPGFPASSKAWVMRAIRKHFSDVFPSMNMFLLDNSSFQLAEASTGSDGAIPCVQVVSAGRLEENVSSDYRDKLKRKDVCLQILAECKRRIIQRIEFLKKQEHEEQRQSEPSETPPILHTIPATSMTNPNLHFKPEEKLLSANTGLLQGPDSVVNQTLTSNSI
jgi:hypothetical protein